MRLPTSRRTVHAFNKYGNMTTVPPDTSNAQRFDAETPLGLIDLFIMLAKHKRALVGVPLAVGALAAAISLALPNVYTGSVRILPPQGQSGASALLGQLGALGGLAGGALGGKTTNETYIGMLGSRTVSDELIAQFKLAEVYEVKLHSDARLALKNATTFTNSRDGMIIIEVDDWDAKRAAAMANAYAESLRKLTQTLAVTEAARRRLFFQTQLEQAKASLADAEEQLRKTQERTGLIQLSGQAQGIIEAAANLKASIAAKEVALRAMRTFATANHPEYLRAEQELAGLRAELAKVERSANGGNGDIAIATAKVPGVALEYARKLRDVKYFESMFELLAKQYELARIDEAKDSAMVQVLDAADVPDSKSKPRRSLIVLIAMLASFVLTASSVMLKELWQAASHDPRSASRIGQLKALLAGRPPRP